MDLPLSIGAFFPSSSVVYYWMHLYLFFCSCIVPLGWFHKVKAVFLLVMEVSWCECSVRALSVDFSVVSWGKGAWAGVIMFGGWGLGFWGTTIKGRDSNGHNWWLCSSSNTVIRLTQLVEMTTQDCDLRFDSTALLPVIRCTDSPKQ